VVIISNPPDDPHCAKWTASARGVPARGTPGNGSNGTSKVLLRGDKRGVRLTVVVDDVWRCRYEFSVYMRLPCRHVIAFRKSGSPVGPVIPWSSIDERYVCPCLIQDVTRIVIFCSCTNYQSELKKVSQFSYNRFCARTWTATRSQS